MRLAKRNVSALALVLGSLSIAATAAARDDDDPPGRVAHLSYLRGSVSFRPGGVDDWTEANANYPLTTGDHLWADEDARGELHIGSAVVRLGPSTAFSFLNLDDRIAQMRVSEGQVSVRVNRLDEDEAIEVDTPNAAVSLLRPGFYRIDVRRDGDETIVTVRHGEAEVTSGGSAFPVRSRESAYVSGGDDSPRYDVRDARDGDDWEDWCEERDRREERSVSTRYVSREMIGSSALDDYGGWREDNDYGPVWIPSRVDVGWAPYRYGHWAWVFPWGWTWVDDSPWGFAPFHYGRWAYVGGVWAWCPGRIVARPVYAPALVVFLGGANWAAGLSIGDGVGWFPLGPREVYVPPYAHSRRYVENVNITQVNVTNINITNVSAGNATWVNRNVRGAVTAVPRNDFVRARPLAKAAVVVPMKTVRSAQVVPGDRMRDEIRPQRESVVGGGRVSGVAKPPEKVAERRVVARLTPPAPVPFSEQGKPRPEAVRRNPLVRSAVPEGSGSPTLRPVRTGIPKAQPISPRDIETPRRPRDAEGAPEPSPRVEPEERRARPTPRPTPRVEPEERRTRPTPRPEPEERPTPRPTPRVEPQERPTPRPTPRVEPGEKPTPRPTPRVEPEERRTRPTPRPEPEEKPTPRPTPRVEPQERPTPRPTPRLEPEDRRTRPTPRLEPEARPTPRPTPRPEAKPTPKPSPSPSPKKP